MRLLIISLLLVFFFGCKKPAQSVFIDLSLSSRGIEQHTELMNLEEFGNVLNNSPKEAVFRIEVSPQIRYLELSSVTEMITKSGRKFELYLTEKKHNLKNKLIKLYEPDSLDKEKTEEVITTVIVEDFRKSNGKKVIVQPEFITYSVKELKAYLIENGTYAPNVLYLSEDGYFANYSLNDGSNFLVSVRWGYIENWGIYKDLPKGILKKDKKTIEEFDRALLNKSKGVDWKKAEEDYLPVFTILDARASNDMENWFFMAVKAQKEHKLIQVFFTEDESILLGNIKASTNVITGQKAYERNGKFLLEGTRIKINLDNVKNVKFVEIVVKPSDTESLLK